MKKQNRPNGKMPLLFVGHGSPMNALADNEYTQALNKLGEKCPRPAAILSISAHWMTKGTFVTHMERPKTIHDFYGFPEELFKIQYPAPGSLAFSELIANEILEPVIELDENKWGLDHGTWSVMRHLYPKADIPIFQLSLDMTRPFSFHYELGMKLKFLRELGVLIVGSGNIVHNLRAIDWNEKAAVFKEAIEFDQWVKTKIAEKDFKSLTTDILKTEAGRFSVPTPDHYYPLLYILGASDEEDHERVIFEGFQNASISMRSFLLESPPLFTREKSL